MAAYCLPEFLRAGAPGTNMDPRVLYEDNHVIAVYKPAGMLVQEDSTGDPSLLDQVKFYLKKKYNKPGKVFLGLVHRLDRPVAGVIVFGKTSKGAARLSEQFRAHTVRKLYHALVIGKPRKSHDVLLHHLRKDPDTNRVYVHESAMPDTQHAELEYTVAQTNGNYSIVRIELKTGRGHQIRSQLAHIGCPIVGDVKYGAPKPLPDKSIALVATSLTFMPATGEGGPISVTADIPEIWRATAR